MTDHTAPTSGSFFEGSVAVVLWVAAMGLTLAGLYFVVQFVKWSWG